MGASRVRRGTISRCPRLPNACDQNTLSQYNWSCPRPAASHVAPVPAVYTTPVPVVWWRRFHVWSDGFVPWVPNRCPLCQCVLLCVSLSQRIWEKVTIFSSLALVCHQRPCLIPHFAANPAAPGYPPCVISCENEPLCCEDDEANTSVESAISPPSMLLCILPPVLGKEQPRATCPWHTLV